MGCCQSFLIFPQSSDISEKSLSNSWSFPDEWVPHEKIRQWWSILRMHRWHMLQWWALGGLGATHFLQIDATTEMFYKTSTCIIHNDFTIFLHTSNSSLYDEGAFIHTVSIKTPTLISGYNFCEYWTIFKILLPAENSLCICTKDFHFTLTMLLHYLVITENSK